MTVSATLVYTSSREAGTARGMARVAAGCRVSREREAARAKLAAREARVLAHLREDFPGVESFGVKVCEEDAKWRATDVTAEFVAYLVASVGDVEYWPAR